MAQAANNTDNSIEVAPRLVVGVIGLGLCFTRFLACLMNTPGIGQGATAGGVLLIQSSTFLAACFVTYFLLTLVARFFASFRIGIYIAALLSYIGSVACGAIWSMESSGSVALSAFSVILAFSLYVESLCAHKTNMRKSLSAGLVFGSLIYLLAYLISSKYSEISSLLFGFLPLLIFPACLKFEDPNLTWYSIPTLKDVAKVVPRQSHLLTFSASLVMGFALYWPLHNGYSVTLDAFLRFAIFILLIMVCADSFFDVLFEKQMLRVLRMPITLLCVLPLFFLPVHWWGAACFATIVVSFISYTSVIFALGEVCEQNEYNPLFVFSYGRLSTMLGLLLGLLFGWLGYSSGFCGQYMSGVALFVVVMVMIFVFILYNSRSYYPGHEPEVPLTNIATKADEDAIERVLTAKCARFARIHELTSRQAEVVNLLARGHSSDYVSKELVISPHTVKAHIYSIYQKSEVHSRQELIELINGISLEDELKGIKEDSEPQK